MLRFVHAADLHLGQTMKKIKKQNHKVYQALKQATIDSYNRLIDIAINEEVDCVLLAGDLYDSPEGTLAEQFALVKGLERLDQAGIASFILFGNHDYKSQKEKHLALPASTRVFPRQVTTLEFTSARGDQVAITGFSYPKRWLREDYSQYFPKRYNHVDYHIGMFHGQERQGNSQQDHYAPFQKSHLQQLAYDYWALGHIHVAQQLSGQTPIVYPGNIQGTHFKETGSKGGVLVSLEPGKDPIIESIETTDWQFKVHQAIAPPIQGVSDLQTLFQKAYQDEVDQARAEGLHYVLRLHYRLDGSDSDSLAFWEDYAKDLFDQLQWQYQDQDDVFLADLRYEVKGAKTLDQASLYEQALMETLDYYQDPEAFDQALNELFDHPLWQRHLQPAISPSQFQEDVLAATRNKILLSLYQK
ncbi:metallophosphoesterase family protein [Aerococcus urinae]|uniref:metallophosphoesterase family protein n=1 Tax=Aerococcus urinae TaxID=1376 RepID=UPI0018A7909A|nr:DNA repair exonuclease [Aerococcus urinae]